MIYDLGSKKPQFDEANCFVADSASVIGEVKLGENVSIWFGAVLRGDNAPITIGVDSNIQENSVLHVDDGFPVVVGNGVTVGHQAVLHGCTVEDNALIGINAVILNGAVIGKNSLVGANSLVTPGKVIPENSLVIGSPGRVVRKMTEEEVAENRLSAEAYVAKAREFRLNLKGV